MSDQDSLRRWREPAARVQTRRELAIADPALARGASCATAGLNPEWALPSVSTRRAQGAGILVADDHPIFRDGLRKLVESQPGMWIAGECSLGDEVLSLVRDLKPEIVVLDLGLPRGTGFRLLAELGKLPTPVPTLVLAEAVDQSSILEAFYLGAFGIVLKGSPRDVLLKSICSVLEGQYWLDSATVPIVIQALRKSPSPQTGSNARDFGLTPQQLKIVGRVANGSSNKEVGQEFSISERTVKHHLTNVFNKLGISSRLELAVFAFDHGLVDKR